MRKCLDIVVIYQWDLLLRIICVYVLFKLHHLLNDLSALDYVTINSALY